LKSIILDKNNKFFLEDYHLTHRKGIRHLSLGIVLFNKKNELLIHRKKELPMFPYSLWNISFHTDNFLNKTQPLKTPLKFSRSMLKDFYGFNKFKLKKIGIIEYREKFSDYFYENERMNLYFGFTHEIPSSVKSGYYEKCKFLSIEVIQEDIKLFPQFYTPWFKFIMIKHGSLFERDHLEKLKKELLDNIKPSQRQKFV
jgi:isopentenyldiphosphate isomerase